MNELVNAYAMNPQDSIANYNLAVAYHEYNEYAAALSFYIRCKERTDDFKLKYKCLVKAIECLRIQGKKEYVIYDLYNNIINLCKENVEESRKMLREMSLDEIDGDEMNIALGCISGVGLTEKTMSHNSYNKDQLEFLRYKFPGVENIDLNYAQAYQDLFVLSMLKGKRCGTFLEIGGAYPYYGNNTAILEDNFEWSGVTIEWGREFCEQYSVERKNTKVFCDDATKIGYKTLLDSCFDTKVIDYLQLDIEPAFNTYNVLLKIPFDEYKFAVITYEHDHYIDSTRQCRQLSRQYLESKGYVMVVNDISNDGVAAYEDWWVHPDLVDKDVFEMFHDIIDDPHESVKYMLPGLTN